MKTKSLFFMLLAVALSLFTACSNDDEHLIWDIYPIEFHIYVQDAAGRDLLNPETEGNILKQDIYAIYDLKNYKLNEESLQNGIICLIFTV